MAEPLTEILRKHEEKKLKMGEIFQLLEKGRRFLKLQISLVSILKKTQKKLYKQIGELRGMKQQF